MPSQISSRLAFFSSDNLWRCFCLVFVGQKKNQNFLSGFFMACTHFSVSSSCKLEKVFFFLFIRSNSLFSNVSSVVEIYTPSLCNDIIFSLLYLTWAPTCFPLALDNRTIVRTRNPSCFSDSAKSVLWHLQSPSAAQPNNPTQCQLRVCLGWFSANQLYKVDFLDYALRGVCD